jgi:hypothetical protein
MLMFDPTAPEFRCQVDILRAQREGKSLKDNKRMLQTATAALHKQVVAVETARNAMLPLYESMLYCDRVLTFRNDNSGARSQYTDRERSH